MFKGNGNVNIALARDGTLVYVPGVFSAPEMSAIWMDRNGTATDAVATPLPLPRDPALSTDGGKLAVTTGANATGDIWVFDLRGAAQPRKMTFEGDDASPLWSKDGSRLFSIRYAKALEVFTNCRRMGAVANRNASVQACRSTSRLTARCY